eukprot:366321-Chlamydomonas_euryale.AAC.8
MDTFYPCVAVRLMGWLVGGHQVVFWPGRCQVPQVGMRHNLGRLNRHVAHSWMMCQREDCVLLLLERTQLGLKCVRLPGWVGCPALGGRVVGERGDAKSRRKEDEGSFGSAHQAGGRLDNAGQTCCLDQTGCGPSTQPDTPELVDATRKG